MKMEFPKYGDWTDKDRLVFWGIWTAACIGIPLLVVVITN